MEDSTEPILACMSADMSSHHRQDQLPERVLNQHHQLATNDSLKRPANAARPMSAKDVELGQQPAIKRPKELAAAERKQLDNGGMHSQGFVAVETKLCNKRYTCVFLADRVGVNSISMANTCHDTVRSAGVNETYVTTVASCRVEDPGLCREPVRKADATDGHGVPPEHKARVTDV